MKQRAKEHLYSVLLVSIPLVILGGILVYLAFFLSKDEDAILPPPVQEATTTILSAPRDNPFDRILLTGQSAYVYDVRTKKAIYEKNADASLPLASITKLFTAYAASKLIPDFDQKIVTIPNILLSSTSMPLLLPGEKWNMKDILNYTLVSSTNEGAMTLAHSAGTFYYGIDNPIEKFVTRMNEEMKKLNYNSFVFHNPSGLDESLTKAGGYGSAKEVAHFVAFLLENEPELLAATKNSSYESVSEGGRKVVANNTNQFVDVIPTILGSKTGYTDLAGGNLVVAYDQSLNQPVIAVVLGSTFEGRFADVLNLASTTRAYFINTGE